MVTSSQIAASWTLAALFTSEQRQQLASEASLERLAAGQPIRRSAHPTHLHLVVKGEVTLFARFDRGVQRGRVRAGRIIEQKTLLSNESHWQYDWYAETTVELLSFPRSTFDALLKQAPKVRDYLVRVTEHAEIERLATDLRFFGFSEIEIGDTIATLTLNALDANAGAKVQRPFFAVVHEGELALTTAGEAPRVISSFGVGDYVVLAPHPEVVWSIPKASLWLLAVDLWTKLVDANRAQQFLAFADPFTSGEASRALRPKAVPKPVDLDQPQALDDEDDDGIEVEHFQCEPAELAKLLRRKRPIIRQHDEMDCGAACMAMVTQFHGKHISMPTYRGLVQVSKDGASMLALKKAANLVGFDAIGVMASLKGLEGLRVPFIALCEYHFVVVYEVTDTHVILGDPAQGRVVKPIDAFQKEYSQVALLLKPNERLKAFPESRQEVWKYLSLLQGAWGKLSEIMLAAVLTFVLGLATPLFLQLVFDKVLADQKKGLLNVLALAVLLLSGASGAMGWVRTYLTTHLGTRLDAKFSTLFMKHVLSLPMAFFAVRRVGDITSRLDQLRQIREFATSKFPGLFMNALTATVYLAILALYRWQLTLVVAGCLVPLIIVVVLLNRRVNQTLATIFKAEGRSSSLAFEHFNSLETIKSLGGTVTARWRWQHATVEGIRLRLTYLDWAGVVGSFATFLQAASSVVFLVVTATYYMQQQLTLGQVVAANTLLGSILGPLFAIVNEWSSLKELSRGLERIDDVVTAPSENFDVASDAKAPDAAPPPDTVKGTVELKNVTFQYGGDLSPTVLDEVSLKIDPGSTVAFVGRSGSGKTTLGYMVNLMYAPSSGSVSLDGFDASKQPLDWVRRQVGVIVQENSVFSGTILENIALGDPNPSFKRVMDAAMAADAHEFIAKMPDGYSTVLGEGGSGLSGGQRQRLNIARALYRDPPVLVMDEATAALDAISEQRIVKAIKRRKRTTIVIAHRLNTIMHADKIVVLDGGRIVESGSHHELMERRELYFNLFRRQLSG